MLDGFALRFAVLAFCKNPFFMPQIGFVVASRFWDEEGGGATLQAAGCDVMGTVGVVGVVGVGVGTSVDACGDGCR